jgi:RNA polymerase sigma-70 factor (ECF subfamily)
MVRPDDDKNASKDSMVQEFMHLYVGKEQCIQSHIYTLVHNWAAAEDILQETAHILWLKFNDFEPGTDFMAWALAIAHYQVLKFRKSQDKRTLFGVGEKLPMRPGCVGEDVMKTHRSFYV